jgi:hypothetical protein
MYSVRSIFVLVGSNFGPITVSVDTYNKFLKGYNLRSFLFLKVRYVVRYVSTRRFGGMCSPSSTSKSKPKVKAGNMCQVEDGGYKNFRNIS